MMKNKKKRKVTSTSTTPWPLHTTIDSLPDDVVADILLRLPSAAAIYRAVLASEHWIRVASSPTFLRRLRDIHDYPLLLGHLVSPDGHGTTPPCFYPATLHTSDSDGLLAAMVRRGDFFLTRIQVQGSGQHVLEDCRGGLLLLSDAGTLRVFDPMTHRVSSVDQLPRRGGRAPDHRGRRLCLLPNGDDPDAFRVMSLQHGNAKKLARLEVYNSCTRAWRVLTGAGTAKIPARKHMAKIYRGQYAPAMHAGDRIFWKYDAANLLLSLDTQTMTFSNVCLPPGVTRLSAYAVGETEDGTCCLVHVLESGNRQMQVWRFKVGDDHEGNGDQMWELERQVPLILASPSACLSGCQVGAIVGGIVVLCFNNSSLYQPHIAFRLKTLKVETEFTCRGLARPFVIK
ncbi:hypothetical protein BDA96_01G368100 [Sorghum bicolor]|uniref:F-box protein AT5G49610-like beta-propeller domain-containing protein n=2 Tax=Sorghum bicolor TaxID=4558 RepID=A0A921UZT2_SORBI|nr:uncharacterized protein LOC110433111 isoform X1 [Sorghum bicolor]KAG0550794.1 hypothetical protein BDA96_01G368100 [Sorghum bicolor]OQU92442.1 hypothetical protein SORBI_3001G345000 [Sorghum bicolor]|eukprot:XP_021310449.1 uncharacterized protein LOC110433111 isoform X1 [Sorghum bicolor]